MTELSKRVPATQAVINAIDGIEHPHLIAQAAIRAVVDQIAPEKTQELPPPGESFAGHYVHGWTDCQTNLRADFLEVVSQLEPESNA